MGEGAEGVVGYLARREGRDGDGDGMGCVGWIFGWMGGELSEGQSCIGVMTGHQHRSSTTVGMQMRRRIRQRSLR